MSKKYFDLILPALCANPALANQYPDHLVRQAWQIAVLAESWAEEHGKKVEAFVPPQLRTAPEKESYSISASKMK